MFNADSWQTIWLHRQAFIDGLQVTLIMAFFGLLTALVIGVVLGLLSTSEKKVLKIISRVYVEFFQNTPLMLQALFLFYAVVFSGVKGFTPLACGIIALGLYHGAYIAEVIRAGVESVPFGQGEASYSQGFTYGETMWYVILPQTVKIILPPMINQVVNLIKNTSCMFLAGGAVDLISRTNAFAVGEGTASAAGQSYITGGVIFFLVCFPLSTLAGFWESRLKKRETAGAQRAYVSVGEITDEELDMIIDGGSESEEFIQTKGGEK